MKTTFFIAKAIVSMIIWDTSNAINLTYFADMALTTNSALAQVEAESSFDAASNWTAIDTPILA